MTAPWQSGLGTPYMPDLDRLRGMNPQGIPLAPVPEMPGPVQQPGLLQRIAGGLFPTPGGLLDPEQTRQLQRQGLLQLGLGLLANSGQRVVGTPGASFGERLAMSFPNWQQMVQGAVAQQGAMQQMQAQGQIREIASRYRPKEGETAEQRFERISALTSELAGVPGSEELVGRLSNVLAQLRPESGQRRLTEVRRGTKVDLVDPVTGETVRTLDVTADPNVTDARNQQRSDTWANQQYGRYLQQTAKERDIALNYNAVLSAGADPSPAGDLSLIFAYMKMLDPGSVVREGEFATAANTGAVPERVRSQYNKVVSGERLTTTQRADFLRQAKNRASGVRRSLNAVIQEYGRRARKRGIDPDDVSYDYFEGLEAPTNGERPPLNFR